MLIDNATNHKARAPARQFAELHRTDAVGKAG
jgi:hypothetical protein